MACRHVAAESHDLNVQKNAHHVKSQAQTVRAHADHAMTGHATINAVETVGHAVKKDNAVGVDVHRRAAAVVHQGVESRGSGNTRELR